MSTWGDILQQTEEDDFIGRVQQLRLFENEIMRHPPRKLIFYIHGQGGAGKTKLLTRFGEMAEAIGFVTAHSDDQQEDIPRILGRFAQQLTAKGHKLPKFTERYETYRRLREEIETDPAAPQGFPGLFARAVVRVGFAAMEQAPMAGPLSRAFAPDMQESVLSQADEWASYVARKFKNKDEVLLVKEPLAILPGLFFKELNEITKKQDQRILLTFDNYEYTRRYLDEWLVGLPQYEPDLGIRLVVAGRNPPGPLWEPLRKAVQEVVVDVFSPEEAETFLDQEGITNPNRREEIVQLSGRLPVLMSWLAAATGEDDSPVLPSADIVERFLKWVQEPDLRQAALVLAVPRFFNLDLTALLLDKPTLAEAETAFAWLCELPSVSQREPGWQYHEVVRGYLLHYLGLKSEQTYRQLHSRLAPHYEAQRQALGLDEKEMWQSETWHKLTLEYAYHHLLAAPEAHWNEYVSLFVLAIQKRPSLAKSLAQQLLPAVCHRELTTAQKELAHLFVNGLEAWDLNKYQEALPLFNQLCAMPNLSPLAQARALACRGTIFIDAQQYERALADFTRALELDPKYAWAIAGRGGTYLLMRQYETAVADFTRAIELAPKYASVIASRGLTYCLMEQYETAVVDFDRALELNSKMAWTIASRGLTYHLMKQYKTAVADYTHAIELDPKMAWAIAQRGQVYRLMEQYETAVADFNRALELDPKYAWAIAHRGETYRLMKEYETAVTDFTRAIELDPEDAWIITLRGLTYREMGQYGTAVADFDCAIELDPKMVLAIVGRGETYRLMEEYETAVADFTRAIELDPKMAWAITSRGQTYHAMEEYQTAVADFTRAIELDPKMAWAIASRGEAYHAMGQYETAITDFDRAIELDPKMAWAIAHHGETYRLMEQYETAITDFTRAIELDPNMAWAIASRGEAYHAMGQYETAITDFDRAIELDPKMAWAIASRGETYRLMEQYETAVADYTRAIELDPQMAWAITSRGQTYHAMEKYQTALADFFQALALKPNDWEYYWRGLTYWKLGQTEAYQADLAEAIRLAQAQQTTEPRDWNNHFNLAVYYLTAGETSQAQALYQAGEAAPHGIIREAINDLNDLLTLFPEHQAAQEIRAHLQALLAKKDSKNS